MFSLIACLITASLTVCKLAALGDGAALSWLVVWTPAAIATIATLQNDYVRRRREEALRRAAFWGFEVPRKRL